MGNTRVLGDVVAAVSSGRFVRVPGIGILVLTALPVRKRRTKEEMKKEK